MPSTPLSAYARLTRRRQRIVDHFVETGNASEAVRRAGYRGKHADTVSNDIFQNQDVRAAVAERTALAVAKAGASQVKFVQELCTLGYARLSQLRDEKGQPLTFDKLPETLLAAAESVEFEGNGTLKRIKLAKTAGLRMLGEVMRALPQTHEVSGPGGGPIPTKDMSDLEVARRIAFLLTQGVRAAAAAPPAPDPGTAG